MARQSEEERARIEAKNRQILQERWLKANDRAYKNDLAAIKGAANSAVNIMIELAANEGQRAALESIRGEFLSLHGEGYYFQDYEFKLFMEYWAGRLNTIMGTSGIPEIDWSMTDDGPDLEEAEMELLARLEDDYEPDTSFDESDLG